MKAKTVPAGRDNSNNNLHPYKGVIRAQHLIAVGPAGSPMIMMLLVDSHLVQGYWPKYMRINDLMYRRGALQDVPENLSLEVYAVREYQTLEAYDTILPSTLDLLEYK